MTRCRAASFRPCTSTVIQCTGRCGSTTAILRDRVNASSSLRPAREARDVWLDEYQRRRLARQSLTTTLDLTRDSVEVDQAEVSLSFVTTRYRFEDVASTSDC
jgi:hypothetical protein